VSVGGVGRWCRSVVSVGGVGRWRSVADKLIDLWVDSRPLILLSDYQIITIFTFTNMFEELADGYRCR